MLKKTGFESLWVKNGKKANYCCKENANIDLVLMDILQQKKLKF